MENPVATFSAVSAYVLRLMVSDGHFDLNDTITISVNLGDANELIVPTQFATIQEAIDAAVNGNHVVLLPQTYPGEGNRDLDFMGKKITICSIIPENVDIVSGIIIDCQGTDVDRHRGFHFHFGENTNSIIDGLTIMNGYTPTFGGAIFCEQSNPTIRNCRIINNNVKNFSSGDGIGHHVASPLIESCFIANNIALGSDNGDGIGGVSGSPIVRKCVIEENFSGDRGGGLYGFVEIYDSIIRGNSAEYEGGGVYGTLLLSGCIVAENFCPRGAGPLCLSDGSIENCIVRDNVGDEIRGGRFSFFQIV